MYTNCVRLVTYMAVSLDVYEDKLIAMMQTSGRTLSNSRRSWIFAGTNLGTSHA